MTYRQFLRELRKTPRPWRLHNDSVNRKKSIRLHHHGSDMVYDPISAVCKFHLGLEFHIYMWRTAALELGLTFSIAERIAMASDGETRRSKTQLDLLRATGLVK